MPVSRLIEFSSCFLVALMVLTVISFLTLRPTLQEVRTEAKTEWDAFLLAVNQRYELLPGLVEAMKAFEPGHGRLVEKSLAARSVAMRSSDPDRIVASVDDIERYLDQMRRLVLAQPDLGRYAPFARHWKQVMMISRRIAATRNAYNKSATLYNRLLTPFPQNILTTVFGFVPLSVYPTERMLGDEVLRDKSN